MRTIALGIIICLLSATAWADLVTTESWSKPIMLQGTAENPVILAPLNRLELGAKTEKVIVVPEELQLKEEIQEFRMFRNRYVIFGVYLFTALYYNWLTRHR